LIRILFTIPNFITAGSGAAMLQVIARLDRKVFEPAVCVLKRGGELDAEVEAMGIPLLEAPFLVPARPYWSLAWRAWRAAQLFQPWRFDIWHSFHYKDDYTEPLIARLSGARAWVYTKKNMNWRGRAWKVRSLLAQGIAAQNTRMLREFFTQPRFRRKTWFIPRGVNVGKFRPGGEARLGMRQRLGTPEGARVLLAVGHVLPVKGHDLLLEAVKGMEGVEVWIAGATAEREQYEKLRRMADGDGLKGKVKFLGIVDDVGALHAEADVFVHPSLQEGCPVALLEAMASGLPCVATRIPGPEDVIEDGVSGLFAPPEDAEALRHAIERVLGDEGLRKRLGEGARQRILGQYTVEREAVQYQKMYLHVLGRSG
jgi:glycosyltransferase involved in cell wall biosynthesis